MEKTGSVAFVILAQLFLEILCTRLGWVTVRRVATRHESVAMERRRGRNRDYVNLASPTGLYKSNPFEVGRHLNGRYTGPL